MHHEVHFEIVIDVQRMDVRGERQRTADINSHENMGVLRADLQGLEQTEALQFPEFTSQAPLANSTRHHAKGTFGFFVI